MPRMAARHPDDPARAGADDSPGFEVIEQQRAHEYVAGQIRRQIGLGIIAAGQSLPPERELMRMFGVGRGTVQLAIGVLEADRLIETRRGRSGGSFVLAPNDESATLDFRVLEVAQSAELIAEAIDYRLVVEPAAARLAAAGRTEAQLAEIGAAADRAARAGSDAEFMRRDTAFHLAIARATGNRFLLDAVEQTRLHLNSVLALLPDDEAEHRRSAQEHDAILSALTGRDAELAGELMRAHVERTRASVHTILTSLRDRPARTLRRSS